MYHQAQKHFRGIFVGILQHQKGCIVYVPGTRKMISSYDVVFYENISRALEYTSQPYAESMAVCPAVTYTLYATSQRGETGDIIIFAQFEEGGILSKTRDNAESGDKSDYGSTMPPLIIK